MFLSENAVYDKMWSFCFAVTIPAILSTRMPPLIWHMSIGRWENKDLELRTDSLKGSMWELSNMGTVGLCIAYQLCWVGLPSDLLYEKMLFILSFLKVRVSYRNMKDSSKLEMRLRLELFVRKGLDSNSTSHHLLLNKGFCLCLWSDFLMLSGPAVWPHPCVCSICVPTFAEELGDHALCIHRVWGIVRRVSDCRLLSSGKGWDRDSLFLPHTGEMPHWLCLSMELNKQTNKP